MKNQDSHIYLYAKGWYKKNNTIEDLGKIIEKRNLLDQPSKYDIYVILLGIVLDKMIDSPGTKDKMHTFFADISPDRFFLFDEYPMKRKEDYNFYDAVINKCVCELATASVYDADGNTLLELDEPDPNILPLSGGYFKKQKEKENSKERI